MEQLNEFGFGSIFVLLFWIPVMILSPLYVLYYHKPSQTPMISTGSSLVPLSVGLGVYEMFVGIKSLQISLVFEFFLLSQHNKNLVLWHIWAKDMPSRNNWNRYLWSALFFLLKKNRNFLSRYLLNTLYFVISLISSTASG